MIAPVRISGCWRNSLGVLPEEWYVELYPLLRELAEQKFRVPEHASEDIVQDVFASFLSKPEPIDDVRAYLIGAVSLASRMYWRSEAKFDRGAALPDRLRVPRYDRILALRRVLRALPHLERRVLILRAQGWRIREIATRIGRSPSWTEKLLRRARKAAAEEMDVTNRGRKGRGVAETDTYLSVRRRERFSPTSGFSPETTPRNYTSVLESGRSVLLNRRVQGSRALHPTLVSPCFEEKSVTFGANEPFLEGERAVHRGRGGGAFPGSIDGEKAREPRLQGASALGEGSKALMQWHLRAASTLGSVAATARQHQPER